MTELAGELRSNPGKSKGFSDSIGIRTYLRSLPFNSKVSRHADAAPLPTEGMDYFFVFFFVSGRGKRRSNRTNGGTTVPPRAE